MKLIATVVALIALGGCVVLRPPKPDERPRWRLDRMAPFDHGCVIGRAFVRKSGKAGIGVTVELKSRGDCAVEIARAELVLGSGQRVPAGIRVVPPMQGRSVLYTWLAFPFDNNAAWNRGDDRGKLEFDLVVNGERAPTWWFPAYQVM